MTLSLPSGLRRYLCMAGLGLGSALAAAALGYAPTLRLGGAEAWKAMAAGCGIAVLAGWVGAIPVCLAGADAQKVMTRALATMALRMAAALVLTLSVVFSGWFEVKILLLWVGIAYVFTLAGETVYLLRLAGQAGGGADAGSQRRPGGN